MNYNKKCPNEFKQIINALHKFESFEKTNCESHPVIQSCLRKAPTHHTRSADNRRFSIRPLGGVVSSHSSLDCRYARVTMHYLVPNVPRRPTISPVSYTHLDVYKRQT